MDEHSQQNIKYGKAFDPAVDGFFHNISLPASHFCLISQSYDQVIMVHFRLLLLLSAYRRHENYKGKHTQNFRSQHDPQKQGTAFSHCAKTAYDSFV